MYLQLAEKNLTIKQMPEPELYPGYIYPRLIEALADSPVVLIHGPRQSGKTTLVRQVGESEGYAYFSFDDDVQRAAAHADPVGYVADLPKRAFGALTLKSSGKDGRRCRVESYAP